MTTTDSSPSEWLVDVAEARRVYNQHDNPTEALRGVDLRVRRGEMVAICGPSGCGKSTLLHLLGAMDRPSGGRIRLGNHQLADMTEAERVDLRRTEIGFVFQAFHLLPTLTVLENVTLPLELESLEASDSRRRAERLLERVGLAHRLSHYPSQLSGGEMQRVAVARAVVHEPLLLLADEPTGSLDSANGDQILALLVQLNRELGQTIIMATHSRNAALHMHRIVHMRDGQVERLEQNDDISETV